MNFVDQYGNVIDAGQVLFDGDGNPFDSQTGLPVTVVNGDPTTHLGAPAGTGTITDAENQANLSAAAQQAANEAGLSLANKPNWTGQNAFDYLSNFKAIIIANPQNFNDLTVQIAQRMNLDQAGFDDRGKLINTADIGLAISNVVLPAVEAVSSAIPVGQAIQAVSHAGSAIVSSVDNVARAIGNSSPLLPVLAPIVLIAAAILLTKDAAGVARSAIRL